MDNRRSSIDALRGLTIIGMVLANYLSDVQAIPAWLKHAPDIGLTVIDLIAPLFIFVIGLTFQRSFEKRSQRDGFSSAVGHAVARSLALIGIGAVISAGQTMLGMNPSGVDWGVLQAIGAASLLALLVVRLTLLYRAGAGLVLLVVYQFCLDHGLLASVLHAPHGGLFGSLAWGSMLILAGALAEVFYQRRAAFGWLALLVLAAGSAWSLISPISKNRVSSSYVLVSLSFGALLFLAFEWLSQPGRVNLGWLVQWGRNPLALYLLHFLLLALVVLPDVPSWHSEAPLWLAALQAAGLLALLSLAAGWLAKRKLFWVL